MKCDTCGGTSFTEDSGLRTCDSCGIEVRNFVALESQEYIGDLDSSQLIRIKKETVKLKEEKETALGVCETYNIILNNWTKTMLSLGASHRFEKIMFELWIWYLQRTGMAFSQEDDSEDTEDFVKLKIDMLQKKKYCYFPSAAGIEGNSVPNVVSLSCFANRKKQHMPDILSFPKLLGMVYLALVLAEEPILLMDLIRWCREGHFPYLSAHNLLPPGCKSEVLLRPFIVDSDHVKDNSTNIAMLLNILYLPIQDYRYVIDRVVKPLRLPVYVGDMALELMKKLFTSKSRNKISVLGIEVYAIAAVVRVLKDFWGLNDYDEYYLSIGTRRINEEIGKKNRIAPLFCWEEWQKYINKLIWYCGEIDYVTNMHSRKADFCNFGEAGSFSRFAWTEGIWRLGVFNSTDTSGITATQCCAYAEKLLDAQGTPLEAQVNQPFEYKPTQLPIHGIVEQFVNSCGEDSKYGHLLQVGKELMDINFSDHLFKPPAKDILQKELVRSGSNLQIVTTIPKNTSKKENKLLVSIPQPPKCLRKSDFRIKLKDVKSCTSRSLEWLLAICFIFFDVSGYEVLQSIKMLKQIYPKKLSH